MNKIKIATWLFNTTIIFYLVYNTYFGWNKLPINDSEKLCDDISKFAFNTAIVMYFIPLLKIYENYIKSKE